MQKSPWVFRNKVVLYAPKAVRAPRRGLEGACPLYERVPTRDESGHLLSDFMMLFPGLRDRPAPECQAIAARVNRILRDFPEVVFADLNLKLNLLWVSVRARPGVILDIACCVKFHVPEALLVGPKYT